MRSVTFSPLPHLSLPDRVPPPVTQQPVRRLTGEHDFLEGAAEGSAKPSENRRLTLTWRDEFLQGSSNVYGQRGIDRHILGEGAFDR